MRSNESSTERDPLLESTVVQPDSAIEPSPPNTKIVQKPGPLEITRSTRYGILAGIWMATFLSVCIVPQKRMFVKWLMLHPYHVIDSI